MQIEWWYWIIAGICLVGLELLVPSFTIIWFGLGALVVGMLKLFWPGFPVAGQVFLWSVASICFTVTWFRFLKPKSDRTHSGTSKEAIVGESGIAPEAPPLDAINDTLTEQLMSELAPRLSEVMEQQVSAELRKSLDQTVSNLLSQFDVSVREIVREAIAEKLKPPRDRSR